MIPRNPPTDDLGVSVPLRRPVGGVVSLVPSLTEAIALTCPNLLVGATDWCTHPANLDVERLGGTKNPNVRRIVELGPGLVVCNQEENRRTDVERMRAAGIAVWVTRIETLEEAFTAMRRLFEIALNVGIPDWLTEAEAEWEAPATGPVRNAVLPIWRDPWMVVGSDTFTGDLARRIGLHLVHGNRTGRYPKVPPDELTRNVDIAILPDEPYKFTQSDGPEMFPNIPVVLVEGRSLTWYGPSLVTARHHLVEKLTPYLRS